MKPRGRLPVDRHTRAAITLKDVVFRPRGYKTAPAITVV
jgi:hypothetical protein